jgi:hypothetical protein
VLAGKPRFGVRCRQRGLTKRRLLLPLTRRASRGDLSPRDRGARRYGRYAASGKRIPVSAAGFSTP